MRRVGNIYHRVVAFDNLLLAAGKAQKRKRYKSDVARFNLNLEKELLKLQRELINGSWMPSGYREFTIYEPKMRFISAAPYRDRVAHHALLNIVEPIFERSFIDDSYANRCGKGTHRAIQRCSDFARFNGYVLKVDIKKYFASIDHELLLAKVNRKIKDEKVMTMIARIVGSRVDRPERPVYFPGDDLFSPISRRQGIPIGNLTSQFFANVYLNDLDHFIKRGLECRYYIRFCDDFVIFHKNRKMLTEVKQYIQDYLATQHLLAHPGKTQIFPVKQGIPFLGFKVFPEYRKLNSEAVRCFRRRLHRLQQAYRRREVSLEEVSRRVQSWVNHASYGDSYGLRSALFSDSLFSRS